MIDAVDLVLGPVLKDFPIQCDRGSQIVAERLFYDDSFPACGSGFEAGLLEVTRNESEHRRWRCHVKQNVSARLILFIQLRHELGQTGKRSIVVELSLSKVESRVEPVPGFLVEFLASGKLFNIVRHL